MVEFEKWASSKGFNVERRSDILGYKDPITAAALEGYQEGCIDTKRLWAPLCFDAANILEKHGLREELRGLWDEFKERQIHALKGEK